MHHDSDISQILLMQSLLHPFLKSRTLIHSAAVNLPKSDHHELHLVCNIFTDVRWDSVDGKPPVFTRSHDLNINND